MSTSHTPPRRHVAAALAFTFSWAAPAVPAFSATPSFLCSQATTWVERTVCDSERLSALDLELALAYANLLRTAGPDGERALTASQQRWWAGRDECRRQSDGVSCLESRYAQRIATLKARPGYSEKRPTRSVDLPPERLADVGEGWSRSLSRYVKAIRACLATAPAPVRWVEDARDDGTFDQAVAVALRGSGRDTWSCTAQRNGLQVLAWHDLSDRGSANAGPRFYPVTSFPSDACGTPVKVLDENDIHVGWLGPACEVVGTRTR